MLTLEKFTLDDYEDYARVLRNSTVMENITGEAIAESEIQRAFNVVITSGEDEPELGFFRLLSHGCYAGYAKFKRYDEQSVELGYFLLPEFWGQGIAYQASGLLIERARANASLTQIMATVTPRNLASKHILTKLGFHYQQTMTVDSAPAECWVLPLNR